jgi:ribonuclease PH
VESGATEIGVIAQEVEEVVPDVVNTNGEGIKSVKYGNLVGVLIEAIKEQQTQIDELKSKIGK